MDISEAAGHHLGAGLYLLLEADHRPCRPGRYLASKVSLSKLSLNDDINLMAVM